MEGNCGHPVRGSKELCGLSLNHKGYHCAYTFTCDACGNTYRGNPYRTSVSSFEYDDSLGFCFLCVKTWERERYKDYENE